MIKPNAPREIHTTYYHMVRQEMEELNAYHRLLQDEGLLTDDAYFNNGDSEPSTGVVRPVINSFVGYMASSL